MTPTPAAPPESETPETKEDWSKCDPQALGETIRELSCRLREAEEHIKALHATGCGYATDADRKANDERCAIYGCNDEHQLQWKWRDPKTLPDKFTLDEAEAAILDAFTRQGGAHVWSGDGSSCAAQIVQAVWERAEAAERRPSLADELRAKGYKEHGQEPNLPIGATERRRPSAQMVSAGWRYRDKHTGIVTLTEQPPDRVLMLDQYEATELFARDPLDLSTVGGKKP